MHHAGSRLFSVSPLRRGSAKQRTCHHHYNLFNVFYGGVGGCCLSAQGTYTFMYLLPDNDEVVGQRAQAALVLRLRGCVASEHPLYVETQDKMQETASLTVLRDRC